MTDSVPTWKYWHPLPFWKMIAIFFAAEIACVVPTLVLREAFGIPVPMWVAAGLAGGLGAMATSFLAKRQREADSASRNPPAAP
jgi:hypothetical protein